MQSIRTAKQLNKVWAEEGGAGPRGRGIGSFFFLPQPASFLKDWGWTRDLERAKQEQLIHPGTDGTS